MISKERQAELMNLITVASLSGHSHVPVYSKEEAEFVSRCCDELKNTSDGTSDGSSADYYKLPPEASQLQDLIAFRDMNAQLGEIFRACYRYGIVKHSPKIRDIKKIIFYAQAELERLEKYEK